jgi:chromate reductase
VIDWASRPADNSPLKGKPALAIGLSVAQSGGARAHAELTPVYLAPSFLVPAIHEKFDVEGTLAMS